MNRLTRLANFYCTDKGTTHGDKHEYTEIYQRYLENYDSPKILEIGTYIGASTKMFSKFYDDNCEIYACDVFEDFGLILKDMPNVHFMQIDLENIESINRVYEQIKDIKFDIIIDDASHIPEHQMNALYAFYRLLKPDGVYIIEDLHFGNLLGYNDLRNPLAFLSMMRSVGLIEPEKENEILSHIVNVHIFSNKNERSQSMIDNYGARSITSIITFDNKCSEQN